MWYVYVLYACLCVHVYIICGLCLYVVCMYICTVHVCPYWHVWDRVVACFLHVHTHLRTMVIAF